MGGGALERERERGLGFDSRPVGHKSFSEHRDFVTTTVSDGLSEDIGSVHFIHTKQSQEQHFL